MRQVFNAIALTALLSTPLATNAALVNRGGGMIYDDVLNITWLADANYAKTSGYDSDGRMNWSDANTWAASLVYGGYSDWRLPTVPSINGSEPCWGLNCNGSELGHMFYNNLGATAGSTILSGSNTVNLALFSNVMIFYYWTGTEKFPPSADLRYNFDTSRGDQLWDSVYAPFYSWAVRDGDVAPVPLPAAAWLLLSGLTGLGVLGRRRKAA